MKEGEVLRRLIRDSGMKQQEFADELNVSRVYLVQLFNKEILPSKIKDDAEAILGVEIEGATKDVEARKSLHSKDSNQNHSKEVELLKEIIRSKDETIHILKEQLKKYSR